MSARERAARQTAKRKLQRATETGEEREVRLAKRRAQYAARRQRSTAEAKCAAAGRTSSQPTDDSREHGQGFLTESKAGAVVGTCAACGSFITFPPVPGVGTQTEAKHEGTQTRALVCARGTQTST
ncbi:uncharacterized protein LOC144128233 isoform X5 [Amblyomma americanum]